MKTSAAQAVELFGSQMYDAACKTLFAEKEILAWIMKLAVPGYEELTPKEIVPYIQGDPEVSSSPLLADQGGSSIQGDNVEDSTVTEGTIYYDIKFSATVPKSQGNVKIIVNIEAQGKSSPGYPLTKRALYYCARLLSAQNRVEFKPPHYGDLKKVYSIWIVRTPPQYAKNTVTEYTIQEKCKIGQTRGKPEDYDVLQAVFIYLGDYSAEQENDGLKLLNLLRSRELCNEDKKAVLEDTFQIAMTEKIEAEVDRVCNWSSAVLEEGIEEGMEKGMLANMLKVFLKLIAKGFSFEEAADTAGAETPEEVEYLRQHLPAGAVGKQ